MKEEDCRRSQIWEPYLDLIKPGGLSFWKVFYTCGALTLAIILCFVAIMLMNQCCSCKRKIATRLCSMGH